jgi:molecular chaperone DnaK
VSGVDVTKDSTAQARIIEAAEKAKVELSTTFSTQINLPFIAQNAQGPVHLDMELSRAKLEELIDPILKRLVAPMSHAVKDANIGTNQIDKIILVGGPTRMPSVREQFKKFFGREPERSIDPMECVCMGAAVQGAVLAGEVNDLLLLDVTPLTLGIETLGGVSTPLIERNTTIPCDRSKIFSTAGDGQTAVEIVVLQGERPMAQDNLSLGHFRLEGIPPAPRGIPQIEVKFSIDANGIVNVHAKDLGTGKAQQITIQGNKGLSENDIKKMVDDAKKFEADDKIVREKIEIRNKSEALVYQAEKMMKDNPDKLDETLKNDLVAKIETLKDAIKVDEAKQMEKASKDLEETLYKFGSKFYGQGGPQGAGDMGGMGGPEGPGGMGGMSQEDIERMMKKAGKGGKDMGGGASYDEGDGSKKKKRSVDVDWEEDK